jgi:hypothetical protein
MSSQVPLTVTGNFTATQNTQLGNGQDWLIGASNSNIAVDAKGNLIAGKKYKDGLTPPPFSWGGSISNWGAYMLCDGTISSANKIVVGDGSRNPGHNPWDPNTGFLKNPNVTLNGDGNIETYGKVVIKNKFLQIGNTTLNEAQLQALLSLLPP